MVTPESNPTAYCVVACGKLSSKEWMYFKAGPAKARFTSIKNDISRERGPYVDVYLFEAQVSPWHHIEYKSKNER